MLTHGQVAAPVAVESPVHRLDARVKLLCAVALVVAVLIVPVAANDLLLAYAGGLLVLALASRLPLRWVLTRMTILAPFLVLGTVAVMLLPPAEAADAWKLGGIELSSQAVSVWLSVGGKSVLSLLAAVLLAGTTGPPELLRAARAWHIPKTLTTLTGFAITYLHVLLNEAGRMLTAMRSRGRVRGTGRKARAASAMLVTLMVRAAERADRIAMAMVSRGYRGQMPVLQENAVPAWQWAVACAVIATAGALTWVGVAG